MKRLLQTRNTLKINKDRVSRKNIRNKDHIIISGVSHMIGDAVMNQIHYPLSVTNELSDSLNNKRIIMPSSHPVGDQGEFISASDPLALTSNFVGAFAFNFSMQDDKLISDVAIDPKFAESTESGKDIINAINNGDPIDVSTGFYLNIDEQNGFGSDGEPFIGVASNLFLDHVAFLPNEEGAKNKLDGVGLHTNSAVDLNGNTIDTDIVNLINNASTPAMQLPLAPDNHVWNESAALARVKTFTNSAEKPSTNYRKFFLNFDQSNVDSFESYTNLFADIINGVPHAVKSPIESASNNENAKNYSERFSANNESVITKAWNAIKSVFSINKELSHSDIDNKIHEKLNEGRTDDMRHFWPMEIFSDKFVYRGDNDTMYMQSYALVDEKVIFIGERKEVERVVEFKTVTNNNGDLLMDRDQLIALLANKGITVNTDITDADLKAKLDEAIGGKGEPKADVKNNALTVETMTLAINTAVDTAVAAAVKPLQEQLTANADKELNDLAKQVGGLDAGISEEIAKTMGVNALTAFLAKRGVVAFNSANREHKTNTDDSLMDQEMPMAKEG